ncbi:MAG TPA: OmpH family outer membrane protein, partial [Phycisphaerales bacterium]|nr:OmpH family outer membrane protein [Phycisphaerales bacterium]
MNRQTIAAFAAAAAITAAFLTGTSVARSSKGTPDNKIATVNIQTIFDSLTERKDRLEQLQAEAARLEGEFAAINRNINGERDAATKMPEGPAKEAAMDAAIDKDVMANINAKKAKTKLEKEQAATIRTIFEKIQKESAKQAQINGYTMVMASDDWVQMSPRATSQELTQMMSLRRFLYVDGKQHDITAEVLTALNNAYAATKGAAPAPAPAAPTTPGATPARP